MALPPELDLQKHIRARLVATAGVTELVAAASIIDKNKGPETFPCIIIGEGQTLEPAGIARRRHPVYADMHIWAAEPGLAQSKMIAGAIREAMRPQFHSLDNHHVADLRIAGTRYLRDPDGLHSHAVLTVYAELLELAT